MSREYPTSPAKPAPAVKSGFRPKRAPAKSYAPTQGDPNTDVLPMPSPVPYPGAQPHAVPAPRPPRPAHYQRVEPSPRGRVDPPAGNAHPAASYAAPGQSEGYGQGGYAPSAPEGVQAAHSPLLAALLAMMRGYA